VPPTWAGLVLFPHPRPHLRLGFACDEHRFQLAVSRPIEPRDHVEAEAERVRSTIEDKQPWVPDEPIATGREADKLLAAARRWYEQHFTDTA